MNKKMGEIIDIIKMLDEMDVENTDCVKEDVDIFETINNKLKDTYYITDDNTSIFHIKGIKNNSNITQLSDNTYGLYLLIDNVEINGEKIKLINNGTLNFKIDIYNDNVLYTHPNNLTKVSKEFYFNYLNKALNELVKPVLIYEQNNIKSRGKNNRSI